MALHLPIGGLKTRSGLEPVLRCEPSTIGGLKTRSGLEPVSRAGNIICYCVRNITHSTGVCKRRKEGNVLFNDALNTFYLRLHQSWSTGWNEN